MSRTIRISKELDAYITQNGRFGETHDDVLRRNLQGFADFIEVYRNGKDKNLNTANDLTPKAAYEAPLMEAMYLEAISLGNCTHRVHCDDACRGVNAIMRFTDKDQEKNNTGVMRWQKEVHWMRYAQVSEGRMEPSEVSGRGFWQLTEAGAAYAEELLKTKYGKRFESVVANARSKKSA